MDKSAFLRRPVFMSDDPTLITDAKSRLGRIVDGEFVAVTREYVNSCFTKQFDDVVSDREAVYAFERIYGVMPNLFIVHFDGEDVIVDVRYDVNPMTWTSHASAKPY